MEKIKKLDFNEKFLLTLYFSSRNHTKITRAMKLMFLFNEVFNIGEKKELHFIAYDYGPFANNFQLNLTPLIVEEIVTYREVCRSEIVSLDCTKEYSFNQIHKEKLINILENDYINQQKYINQIGVIKYLSELFDENRRSELIQFCYYLKPEFSENSIIKEKINKLDKTFNQKAIIKLISALDGEPILKLLDYSNGILNIFNIDEEHNEKNNLLSLLDGVKKSLHRGDDKKDFLIHIMDNMSIDDSEKSLKMLKYKLLEFLSIPSNIFKSNSSKRNFIIFLLKSLQLNWPLDNKSEKIFRKISLEYRKNLKVDEYKGGLEPLIIEEKNFEPKIILKSKYIDNFVKNNKVEEKTPSDKLHTKELFVETTASNLSDEYSETDEEELDISTTEDDLDAITTEQ